MVPGGRKVDGPGHDCWLQDSSMIGTSSQKDPAGTHRSAVLNLIPPPHELLHSPQSFQVHCPPGQETVLQASFKIGGSVQSAPIGSQDRAVLNLKPPLHVAVHSVHSFHVHRPIGQA